MCDWQCAGGSPTRAPGRHSVPSARAPQAASSRGVQRRGLTAGRVAGPGGPGGRAAVGSESLRRLIRVAGPGWSQQVEPGLARPGALHRKLPRKLWFGTLPHAAPSAPLECGAAKFRRSDTRRQARPAVPMVAGQALATADCTASRDSCTRVVPGRHGPARPTGTAVPTGGMRNVRQNLRLICRRAGRPGQARARGLRPGLWQ